MIGLKPYAWIDEGSTKVVHYMISMETATTKYRYKKPQIHTTSTTITITVPVVSDSSAGGQLVDSYTLPAGSASVNTVIIQVVESGTNIKGSVMLRLGFGHFEGTAIRPHCWIKMTTVPNTEVYFVVDLTGLNYTMDTYPTIIPSLSTHTLTLAYGLNTITGTGALEERVFNLNGYDPTTFQFVEIAVSGAGTLRGRGTTSQDDADSSGDD